MELTVAVGGTTAGETSIIGRSRTYVPGAKPLICFAHGYTGSATFMQRGVNWADFVALVEAGFPCIATDMGGMATFGNDVAMAAFDNAITYGQAKTGATGAVHLYVGSMSTLSGLRYAKNNPSKVRSVAVLAPAFDMQYLHDTTPGVSQGGESVAGGFAANVAQDMEASAGGAANLNSTYYAEHSPIVFASPSTLSLPIKAWTSSNDVLANGPVDCPIMATKLGSNYSYEVLGAGVGLGHSVDDIDSMDVVRFFGAYSS